MESEEGKKYNMSKKEIVSCTRCRSGGGREKNENQGLILKRCYSIAAARRPKEALSAPTKLGEVTTDPMGVRAQGSLMHPNTVGTIREISTVTIGRGESTGQKRENKMLNASVCLVLERFEKVVRKGVLKPPKSDDHDREKRENFLRSVTKTPNAVPVKRSGCRLWKTRELPFPIKELAIILINSSSGEGDKPF